MFVIKKVKVIDFFDWLDSNNRSPSRFSRKQKQSIYQMSANALSIYFCDRKTIKKSLERLVELDHFDLHLASMNLEIVINNDPISILPLYSLLFSLFAFGISIANIKKIALDIIVAPSVFILVIVLISFILISIVLRKTVDTVRLKMYIDKAIELQKEIN